MSDFGGDKRLERYLDVDGQRVTHWEGDIDAGFASHFPFILDRPDILWQGDRELIVWCKEQFGAPCSDCDDSFARRPQINAMFPNNFDPTRSWDHDDFAIYFKTLTDAVLFKLRWVG